jgi:hypothetical protein
VDRSVGEAHDGHSKLRGEAKGLTQELCSSKSARLHLKYYATPSLNDLSRVNAAAGQWAVGKPSVWF